MSTPLTWPSFKAQQVIEAMDAIGTDLLMAMSEAELAAIAMATGRLASAVALEQGTRSRRQDPKG